MRYCHPQSVMSPFLLLGAEVGRQATHFKSRVRGSIFRLLFFCCWHQGPQWRSFFSFVCLFYFWTSLFPFPHSFQPWSCSNTWRGGREEEATARWQNWPKKKGRCHDTLHALSLSSSFFSLWPDHQNGLSSPRQLKISVGTLRCGVVSLYNAERERDLPPLSPGIPGIVLSAEAGQSKQASGKTNPTTLWLPRKSPSLYFSFPPTTVTSLSSMKKENVRKMYLIVYVSARLLSLSYFLSLFYSIAVVAIGRNACHCWCWQRKVTSAGSQPLAPHPFLLPSWSGKSGGYLSRTTYSFPSLPTQFPVADFLASN